MLKIIQATAIISGFQGIVFIVFNYTFKFYSMAAHTRTFLKRLGFYQLIIWITGLEMAFYNLPLHSQFGLIFQIIVFGCINYFILTKLIKPYIIIPLAQFKTKDSNSFLKNRILN